MNSLNDIKKLSYEDIKTISLKITLMYNKNGNIKAFCEWYANNGQNYFYGEFTKNIDGYGYDKQSTALTRCLDEFKQYFKTYSYVKYSKRKNCYMSKGHEVYGLYKDLSISYGIGLTSVFNCLHQLKNVKILMNYQGKTEDCFYIDIKGGLNAR